MDNEEIVKKIKAGNKELMQDLYTKNIPIIKRWVAPYILDFQETEDYLQQAYFAVAAAVENFDESRGGFLTYLEFHVKRCMQKYNENSRLLRVSLDMQSKILKYKKAYKEISAAGTKPTAKEIESITGIKEKEQDKIVLIISGIKSLNEPIIADDDSTISILDTLEAPETTEDDVIDRMYDDDIRHLWSIVRNNLSDRNFLIVERRFINNKSFNELAEDFGISKTRVQQIVNDALYKLRSERLRLWEYAETTDCMLYRSSYSRFIYKNASSTEQCALRELDAREQYINGLKEIERNSIKKIIH